MPYGCLSQKGIKGLMRSEPDRQHIPRNDIVNVKGCAWDIKIDLPSFWEQVKRIRKNDHSPTIHFCTTKFGFELEASNPKEFRHDLVWDKQRGVSFLSANKMPMRSHEMIYVFSKAGAYYKRKDIEGDFKASGGGGKPGNVYGSVKPTNKIGNNEGKRCALSIIIKMNTAKKGAHPTEKPMDLYKFLLERYCPEGGTVLDPTFGSGNSGKAAQALGLKYIGIEKDEGFFKKAKAILLPEETITIEL